MSAPARSPSSRSCTASAGYVSSPSTRTTKSASRVARKPRTTANPLPRRLSCSTVAPASLARSAVASVDALSTTTISACGSVRRKSSTTLPMLRSSLRHGMTTATDCPGPQKEGGATVSVTGSIVRDVVIDPLIGHHRGIPAPLPPRPGAARVAQFCASRGAFHQLGQADRYLVWRIARHDERAGHPSRVAFVPEQHDRQARSDGFLHREREPLPRCGMYHHVHARV